MSKPMTIDEARKLAKSEQRTSLQDKFLTCWRGDCPTPVAEYRFHPTRKWRFDFAWPEHKVAVELHGGAFVQGAHVRGQHQASDFDKLNQAMLLGWKVLQFNTLHCKDMAGVVLIVRQAIVEASNES